MRLVWGASEGRRLWSDEPHGSGPSDGEGPRSAELETRKWRGSHFPKWARSWLLPSRGSNATPPNDGAIYQRRLSWTVGDIVRLLAGAALLACAVHIVTVLAVPALSQADAYSLIARLGPELRLAPLGPDIRKAVLDPMEDPQISAAVCAFDLSTGPVKLTLPVSADGFASIALHQEGGGAFFALSNSAAEQGRLEVVALTPGQASDRAAEDDEDNPSDEVRAVATRTRGFAVFRALALLPSQQGAAAALAAAGSCQHVE
jgi:uncharacterized membrane protein